MLSQLGGFSACFGIIVVALAVTIGVVMLVLKSISSLGGNKNKKETP